MTKLFKRIREDFYWLKMEQEITAFVRSCSSCQRNKILFAATKKGNRYLLTLQDNLTKYSDAIPLATMDSIAVALALAEQFVSRFGCPRVIQTLCMKLQVSLLTSLFLAQKP